MAIVSPTTHAPRRAVSAAATDTASRPVPPGFLWGAAISAHQSEGGNIASDCWLLETLPETIFKEPSAAGCDSWNRYEQDLDIAEAIGLNCYRFGIEWARVEPDHGVFSDEAIDHYVRVLAACHERGLSPMVTCSHFTVPLWFACRGGWEAADSADLFARFCGVIGMRLGTLIGRATTFNEANIHLLARLLRAGRPQEAARPMEAMIAAAAGVTRSPAFSSLLFADPARVDANLRSAHAKGYEALKTQCPDLPIGVSLSMQAFEGGDADTNPAWAEQAAYGDWWEAVEASDFLGVQTYTRVRVDGNGLLPPPDGAPLTGAGYEYRPAALGATIRLASEKTSRPIFVTESGIATDDDCERMAWIDATLAEVGGCRAEGIDVRGYVYWSLLDNFEWMHGYAQRFGLVAVDRATFVRTPKPSAWHLAARIRAGTL